MSLPENCGTNPIWDYWSWSNETPYSELLLFSFLMDPDLFPFSIHFLLLSVPNMHDAQRGTLSLKSINIYEKTPSFAILNMYLVWKRDNLYRIIVDKLDGTRSWT